MFRAASRDLVILCSSATHNNSTTSLLLPMPQVHHISLFHAASRDFIHSGKLYSTIASLLLLLCCLSFKHQLAGAPHQPVSHSQQGPDAPSSTTHQVLLIIKPLCCCLTCTHSQVHHISLFHAASRDLITQSHHQKVVAWLSAAADPPIPPAAAWKVLETGREKFRLSRSR
jgi:hypothetical protein